MTDESIFRDRASGNIISNNNYCRQIVLILLSPGALNPVTGAIKRAALSHSPPPPPRNNINPIRITCCKLSTTTACSFPTSSSCPEKSEEKVSTNYNQKGMCSSFSSFPTTTHRKRKVANRVIPFYTSEFPLLKFKFLILLDLATAAGKERIKV